jgi:hypothetical protein
MDRPIVSVPMSFDFRWLPPTSANLALLTVRIPPGFTQVRVMKHLMEAARPDLGEYTEYPTGDSLSMTVSTGTNTSGTGS